MHFLVTELGLSLGLGAQLKQVPLRHSKLYSLQWGICPCEVGEASPEANLNKFEKSNGEKIEEDKLA